MTSNPTGAGRPVSTSRRLHLALAAEAMEALNLVSTTFAATGPSEVLRHSLIHLRNIQVLYARAGLRLAIREVGKRAVEPVPLRQFAGAEPSAGVRETKMHVTLTGTAERMMNEAAAVVGTENMSVVAEIAVTAYGDLLRRSRLGESAVLVDADGREAGFYAVWMDVDRFIRAYRKGSKKAG